MDQEKVEAFMKEYGELREKHRLDFISVPVYQPNEKGNWDLRIKIQVATIDIPSPDEFIPSHDTPEKTT